MDIDSILVPERTLCSLRASSKKRAFELAAKHINQSVPRLETGDVYRGLLSAKNLDPLPSAMALPSLTAVLKAVTQLQAVCSY